MRVQNVCVGCILRIYMITHNMFKQSIFRLFAISILLMHIHMIRNKYVVIDLLKMEPMIWEGVEGIGVYVQHPDGTCDKLLDVR